MTVNVPARSSLIVESAVFAGRLLTHWRREPIVPIQAVVFPSFLLITYKLLVGKSILKITGTDSLYGLVPMCAVAGAMFGSFAAALSIHLEREWGLLSRLWVMPVNRASALGGRLLAEAIRTLLATVLITLVGVGLGLRFHGSLLRVIPYLLIPVLVGIVFSLAVVAIASRSKNTSALIWLGIPATGSVFSSSGVPPAELLPAWIRPLTHLNPMTSVIECMRELALGGPFLWPLAMSLLWVLGLAAVVLPFAITGYRSAAESRH
ncbi:ABC transporter permease [Mycolicibacterium aichiense]|uniref:ABC transporter permease n=1 Tax=Mycolicibacterium aichiense TaxID=1799 RepID=UPI003D67D463